MTEELVTRLVVAAEKLGWSVSVDDGYWEFEKYSPAGEDFIFSASGDDVVAELLSYYEEFEPDDHVEELIIAKHNGLAGVPDARTLIEDAEEIEQMLSDLYDDLYAAEKEYYEEEEADA